MKIGGPWALGEPRARGIHSVSCAGSTREKSVASADSESMGASTWTLSFEEENGGCSPFENSVPQQSSTRFS